MRRAPAAASPAGDAPSARGSQSSLIASREGQDPLPVSTRAAAAPADGRPATPAEPRDNKHSADAKAYANGNGSSDAGGASSKRRPALSQPLGSGSCLGDTVDFASHSLRALRLTPWAATALLVAALLAAAALGGRGRGAQHAAQLMRVQIGAGGGRLPSDDAANSVAVDPAAGTRAGAAAARSGSSSSRDTPDPHALEEAHGQSDASAAAAAADAAQDGPTRPGQNPVAPAGSHSRGKKRAGGSGGAPPPQAGAPARPAAAAPIMLPSFGKSSTLVGMQLGSGGGFHCIDPRLATDWSPFALEEEQPGGGGGGGQAVAQPGERPQRPRQQRRRLKAGGRQGLQQRGRRAHADSQRLSEWRARRRARLLQARPLQVREGSGGWGPDGWGAEQPGPEGWGSYTGGGSSSSLPSLGRVLWSAAEEAAGSAGAPAAQKARTKSASGGPARPSKPSGWRGFQIAVVNDVSFHHEVTLGVVHALQAHRDRLKVYVHKDLFTADAAAAADGAAATSSGGGASHGMLAYMRAKLPGTAIVDAYHKAGITPADVVFFLSPEFNIDYVREFMEAAKPKLVVMFIHEPRMEISRLRYLLGLHPFTGVATLSPHVAKTLSDHLGGSHVHWMLPTLPADCGAGCAEGFAVQGKFESARRRYDELWREMVGHLHCAPPTQPAAVAASDPAGRDTRRLTRARPAAAAGGGSAGSGGDSGGGGGAGEAAPSQPLPRINVIGSGDIAALKLPAALLGSVFVYKELGYDDYYGTMCRSIGLLPLFNEASGYLKHKSSSSVAASLATGAPLVVPAAFLETYSYIKREHVLLMEPGETDLQAALRLMRSPTLPEDVAAARKALLRLRFVLNQQAAAKLEGLMQAAEGKPNSPGKHPPSQERRGPQGQAQKQQGRRR